MIIYDNSEQENQKLLYVTQPKLDYSLLAEAIQKELNRVMAEEISKSLQQEILNEKHLKEE